MVLSKFKTTLIIFSTIITMLIFSVHNKCFADIKYTFSPFIGLSTEYDTNIFLDRSKRPDLITTIYPGLNLSLEKQKGSITFYYAPGFTYYKHNPRFNYTSQSFSAISNYKLSEYVQFDCSNDYVRTNQPYLDQYINYTGYVPYGGPDTGTIREPRTNMLYLKNINIFQPRLTYQFGRDNYLRFYYRNYIYKDQDPAVSNAMENFLSNEIEYWFNIKNGALFTYEYLKGNFDSSPNFASHTIRPRYTHRFTPHFELYEEYRFLTYHFQNNDQGYNDFDDHAINTGFNYQVSPRIALNGFAGYNILKPAQQNTKDGYNLSLGSVITQQHLTFNAAIVKGYDFDYFVLQDSGATKYWGIVTGLFYDVRPNVRWTVWGSYYNRDYLNGLQQAVSSNRKDDLYTVTSSIFYGFSRFASFEFRYTYSADSSNITSNSYMDHKIMGMITFYNTWSNAGEPTEAPTPSRPVPFGRRR